MVSISRVMPCSASTSTTCSRICTWGAGVAPTRMVTFAAGAEASVPASLLTGAWELPPVGWSLAPQPASRDRLTAQASARAKIFFFITLFSFIRKLG